MTDLIALTQRLCDDPAFEAVRFTARSHSRALWIEMQDFSRNKDIDGLAAALVRDAKGSATVAYASMHARICPDCADIETILNDGTAALAAQAISWYGFWSLFRRGPNGPMPAEYIAGWLETQEPALLERLPAVLDALATG